jgi:cephalosporin hydroxylase
LSAKPKYEYHLKNWSDIQDHLPRLYAAAKGNCMEIGVRSGCSTSALLAGIEEHGGHLTSVDIENCSIFSGHPNWHFIRADSVADADIKQLLAKEYEVLFVDGDHSYEGALSDLKAFGPKAKRIFVHDTEAPDYPGVRLAVEAFVKQTGRKVKYWPGSFGMAEIQ